jgi:hypothetical protein
MRNREISRALPDQTKGEILGFSRGLLTCWAIHGSIYFGFSLITIIFSISINNYTPMPSFLAQPLNWWTNFFFIIISNRGYRRAPLTSSVEKLCLNKSSCIWCFLSFSSFSFPFLLLVFFLLLLLFLIEVIKCHSTQLRSYGISP